MSCRLLYVWGLRRGGFSASFDWYHTATELSQSPSHFGPSNSLLFGSQFAFVGRHRLSWRRSRGKSEYYNDLCKKARFGWTSSDLFIIIFKQRRSQLSLCGISTMEIYVAAVQKAAKTWADIRTIPDYSLVVGKALFKQ